jgi:hypothetical protein
MFEQLQHILFALMSPRPEAGAFQILNPCDFLPQEQPFPAQLSPALGAAFLIQLIGEQHPAYPAARTLYKNHESDPLARFYRDGIQKIKKEFDECRAERKDVHQALDRLSYWIKDPRNLQERNRTVEHIWALFFPEGSQIFDNERKKIAQLRKNRTIQIEQLNTNPIDNPACELVFTGNVLLTIPDADFNLNRLPDLEAQLRISMQEPQRYWYDHPIPVGTALNQNEIIYGLRGLQETMQFEIERGCAKPDDRLTCILSVSVTHDRLHEIAKPYIIQQIKEAGGFPLLDIYLFTENDCKQIVQDIFIPAAKSDTVYHDLLEIFGVDGEYGRHYNFLKVIAALWQLFIQQHIKATFKIDLDQVFPQKELIIECGKSAFEYLKTPLWGSRGKTAEGRHVELGMIAGSLVNDKDIHHSIFTPDIPFPANPENADEYIFYSKLPQALSTEAEMMTRYTNGLNGINTCIQRIHVTGGMNGILIGALRTHRPFTPSFIGRAEDQAYIMSVLMHKNKQLGYVHQPGLIMRHDKASFTMAAMKQAETGKMLGDYIRILYFSAYARELSDDISDIKKILDPFTGCFISYIPSTVVLLRFALKSLQLFQNGKQEEAQKFTRSGIDRLTRAFEFTNGQNGKLGEQLQKEYRAWALFYDLLDRIETNTHLLHQLRKRFEVITGKCRI